MSRRIQSLLLPLALLGCEDPLEPVELVDAPRVLGARLEVEGEPERAAPAPGERVSVSWLVAAPQPEPRLGFRLQACVAAPRLEARVSCAEPPFALDTGEDAAMPVQSFEVPSNLAPGTRVALLGIVCPEGAASADARTCDGPSTGTRVALDFELAGLDAANQNPSFESGAITLDGQAWQPAGADPTCGEAGSVQVAPGSEHVIEVALQERDRDALPRRSQLEPERETLQLSHFVTAGELSSAFETVAWNSSELTRSVTWKAPAEPGQVRFWFVLRDLRGGSDFRQHALCVR